MINTFAEIILLRNTRPFMNLYRNLASVYDNMYKNLFDYDSEFEFYKNKILKFDFSKVVEFGCGTGNLAKRFISEGGFEYLGVDLNKEMISIAAELLDKKYFVQSDITKFDSVKRFDAALITGRTISYLTENKQIIDGFNSIYNCLNEGGVLIFDAIDATQLFEDFDISEKTLEANGYFRKSHSIPNLKSGWTWDWHANYYEKNADDYNFIGEDFSILRAFTHDEIELFLTITGFKLIEILPKNTYTWNDHYYVAIKK